MEGWRIPKMKIKKLPKPADPTPDESIRGYAKHIEAKKPAAGPAGDPAAPAADPPTAGDPVKVHNTKPIDQSLAKFKKIHSKRNAKKIGKGIKANDASKGQSLPEEAGPGSGAGWDRAAAGRSGKSDARAGFRWPIDWFRKNSSGGSGQ